MQPDNVHRTTIDKSRGAGILLPALLAVALAVILFPFPEPAIPVGQPFKAELLLAAFLMLLAVVILVERKAAPWTGSADTRSIWLITASFVAFVLWCGISVLWCASTGWAVHHTLLWATYLGFFLVFACMIRFGAGVRTITTTFVLVTCLTGVLCLLDYVTSPGFSTVEGTIRIRYGKYAELLVTLAPVVWATAMYSRDRRRMLALFGAATLCWLTVMLSLSKGAFIAGIIGFGVFFAGSMLYSGRSFRRKVLFTAGAWLVFTVAVQVLFSLASSVPSTTDYITGKADPTRSTTSMRIFTWNIGRQMARDHWLAGVGADNFGIMFNASRARYRSDHPDEPKDEIAEDYMVERAHNEPLQVLAELGVVGILLLSVPFLIFAVYLVRNLWRRERKPSPFLWATLGGMTAFMVSSLVSSFSFRSAQNGVVFFLVFAIGVSEAARLGRNRASRSTNRTMPRWLTAASLAAATLLFAYGLSKVYAEYSVYQAERTQGYAAAEAQYRSAIAADPEYAGAYYSYADRAFAKGDAAMATGLMREAIDHGIGITPAYSHLAKLAIATGDAAAAEAAYRDALAIYPRAVSVRIEFAIFLENNGRNDEAAKQTDIARKVDLKQANGWYWLIREGGVAAFYRSQSDPQTAAPNDLIPAATVRYYVERIPGM